MKAIPILWETIKPRIREFTYAKLLSELPFFETSIKAKIKQIYFKTLL